MLKAINRVLIIKKTQPFKLQLNANLTDRVNKYWKEFICERKGYWDGRFLSVVRFDIQNFILEIGEAQYSWLIYSRNHNDLDIRSLFVSILLKTLDNKYVIIRNHHNKINIIGGVADSKDLDGDYFSPKACLKRELFEELHLDLENKKHVLNYQMKYLKTPDPGRNYGVVYVGNLNFDSNSLLNYFSEIKDIIDNEVFDLLLLNSEEVLQLDLTDNDISYLKDLINYEANDCFNGDF